MNKKIIFVICLVLNCFLLGSFVLVAVNAQENSLESANELYYINLDKSTVKRGYTVSAFNEEIKLSLPKGVLSEGTGVEIIKLREKTDLPWQLDKISGIYQFDFKNKSAYSTSAPFIIEIKYDGKTDNYKQVFFYDKNYYSWRPLAGHNFPDKRLIRASINFPFARLAVFDYPGVLTSGKASWYKYKGGYFAASPDFPIGSRLRVYNLANNKFVDVTINDYGPERNKHPERVIDLDKKAFAKIASLKTGIIDIRVEPLLIKPSGGRILNIAPNGAKPNPNISARSAIVTDEQTGEILFAKNATSTLPLASLTKLVAIKIFLDAKPTLNQKVVYSLKDEEYNYQYVNKWESARLKVEEGETMSVGDLLYASLVGSANNAVETLVRISGFSRDEFINKMNETVKNWNATSTNFVEPTGLSPQNMSSALDYAIITKEIMKHPIVEKASKISEYKFYSYKSNGKKILHRLRNTNPMIGKNNFQISGSKTGYLDEAGFCLMTRVKTPANNQIIAVTLGAPSREASFSETEDLIRYGIRKINQK